MIYKIENTYDFISHCCIINHKFLDNGAEHYELLKINNNTFDIKKLNDSNNSVINNDSNNNIINNNTKNDIFKNFENIRGENSKLFENNVDYKTDMNIKLDNYNLYNYDESEYNEGLKNIKFKDKIVYDDFINIHSKIKTVIKNNNISENDK